MSESQNVETVFFALYDDHQMRRESLQNMRGVCVDQKHRMIKCTIVGDQIGARFVDEVVHADCLLRSATNGEGR